MTTKMVRPACDLVASGVGACSSSKPVEVGLVRLASTSTRVYNRSTERLGLNRDF